VRHSRTKLLLCIRNGVECCARGVHFHHTCSPFPHRIPKNPPPPKKPIRGRVGKVGEFRFPPAQIITVLGCVRGVHFQLPWLPLAAPGCPWLFLACSWLLLAAPACSWVIPGCSWLLLAASGCSWLFLAGCECLISTCWESRAGIVGS
jgi:hypothetical protein